MLCTLDTAGGGQNPDIMRVMVQWGGKNDKPKKETLNIRSEGGTCSTNIVQNREWPQEVCYFIHSGVCVNSPNKEMTASFMETGEAESQRTQPGKGPKRNKLP